MARLICIMVIIGIALMCSRTEGYTDKFDDTDVIPLLHKKEIRDRYLHCYLDMGPCTTPHMKFITKEFFSDAYATDCANCDDKQKKILSAISNFYMMYEPHNWAMILTKVLDDVKKGKTKLDQYKTDNNENINHL